MLNISKLVNGELLAQQAPELFSLKKGIEITADSNSERGYCFKSISKKKISLSCGSLSDLMMALGDIISNDILQKKSESIVSPLEFRGLMLDASRNAVPKVEFLKKVLLRLSLMGMNHFCLYTEDTYEVEGEPLFGYGRGKYTRKEIGNLVAFSEKIGITMFPCIQVLGHLEQVLKYHHYKNLCDTDRVLNATIGETYSFLEKIIENAAAPYNTDLIHLGMDETWGIGRGKAFRENTPMKPLELYARHVAKVAEICRRKSLKPIMWGDFVLGHSGEKAMDENETNILPKDIIMNYWNYSGETKDPHVNTIKKFREIGYEPLVSPGLHNWNRFWNHYSEVRKTVSPFMEAVHETGIKRVLMTMWGDDGHENLFEANYHALSMFFAYCRSANPAESSYKKRAEKICGIPFDIFVKFAELEKDEHCGVRQGACAPSSKMFFYDDPLIGTSFSQLSDDSASEIYEEFSCSMKAGLKRLKSHEYADLVKLAALYSTIVSLKIAIVVNSKKAYAGNCRSKLKKQFKAIPMLQKKIAKFHSLYKKLWLKERKPFGLEVMDSRFATMEARAKTLKESIKNYLACRQDSIPEFELEFPRGLTAYDLSSFRKLSTRCLSLW